LISSRFRNVPVTIHVLVEAGVFRIHERQREPVSIAKAFQLGLRRLISFEEIEDFRWKGAPKLISFEEIEDFRWKGAPKL